MSELFELLDRLRSAEGKVALATLVNTRGTTPRTEGAKMLVGERLRAHAEAGGRGAVLTRLQAPDAAGSHSGAKMLLLDSGTREGTLGDEALDAEAVSQGAAAIKAGKSGTLTVEGTRVFAEV